MTDQRSGSIEHEARRAAYFDQREKAVAAHEERAFEYEKQAIAYSNSAYRVLTYLNGGALIAIPAVIALFKSDIEAAKTALLSSAGCFIGGLLLVLFSQACAFFTMARRSESQTHLSYEQQLLVSYTFYPEQFDHKNLKVDSDDQRKKANDKITASNSNRLCALVFMWLAVFAFIVGCLVGGYAVLR